MSFIINPPVATYPMAGGRGEKPKVILSREKTSGSRHQCLFEENVRKAKKRSTDFENKGLGVVYARGRY